jgi:hypothetical protein
MRACSGGAVGIVMHYQITLLADRLICFTPCRWWVGRRWKLEATLIDLRYLAVSTTLRLTSYSRRDVAQPFLPRPEVAML